jgi:hypothetical protein
MDHTDIATTVTSLLAAAGLTPSADELARLVVTYPALKHRVEELYAVEAARYESPGGIFDAAPTFADWAS